MKIGSWRSFLDGIASIGEGMSSISLFPRTKTYEEIREELDRLVGLPTRDDRGELLSDEEKDGIALRGDWEKVLGDFNKVLGKKSDD